MSVQQVIDDWAKVQSVVERCGLSVKIVPASRIDPEVIEISNDVRVLRRPQTLTGALNWLAGYEAGLRDAQAPAPARPRTPGEVEGHS